MGIFDKLRYKIDTNSRGDESTNSQAAFQTTQAPVPPLGPESVIRYRKQRGVNLGAWFVNERWIHDQTYKKAVNPGQSDFDIAKGNDARGILEEHWDNWIKEEDWVWIKEKGFNSVRLPVSCSHSE